MWSWPSSPLSAVSPRGPALLSGHRVLPAPPATPGASGADRTRERAPGVVQVPYTTRPVVALTVAAVTVAVIGTAALLRRRYLRWGATNDELHCSLAGDEILPAVDQSTTRAITISATTPRMLRGINTRAEHARNGTDRTPPLPLPTLVDLAPIRSPAAP